MNLSMKIIEYHCLARIDPMVAFMTGSIRACSSGMICSTKSREPFHLSFLTSKLENKQRWTIKVYLKLFYDFLIIN